MSQSINLYNQLAKNKLFSKKIKFDLKRIKIILNKLNSPEQRLKNVINIIGSDGKYSLLTSLKFFIEANNNKVSAYISPSLVDIKERFWMGEKFLSHLEIKKTIKIIEKQKIHLTIFEALTVIYILNAAKKNNDYNLIEAGALFAKDSTNVFDFPKIQAVVNINKQHLNFLEKKTLNEVIYQKVGFLSNFTNIYIGKQKEYVLKKIRKLLKKNLSIVNYPSSWKLIKRKNKYFYKDKNLKIELLNKYIHSTGLLENLCLAIKIALDLGISRKIIIKTIPKIRFQARIEYINKGKLKSKLFPKEKLLIDGCHSETSAINLVNYLKTTNVPIYGIWAMTKNKEPDKFIKKFNGIFKKLITIPIKNDKTSLPKELLLRIAKKNNYNAASAKDFETALKVVSSREKKIIVCFGSLYSAGYILSKN
tara:strand:+ start:122 stop:1384 length:1263 start_codon:yes stop_codon:yes gene_type:complete